MTDTDKFFREPQAAAVLKHGILRRYLPIFATKTGSRRGEVVYVDSYAGPGLYGDGSPASPALALGTANAVAGSRGRATIHGHLIEEERKSVTKLENLLAAHGSTWEAHHGQAEDHLPTVLDGLADATPLFVFIDPFGLAVPFDLVVRILNRRAPTEVLLNFSVSGINRVGGQLTGKGTDERWLKARSTQLRNLDAVLGGDWWQPIWESGAADRVDQIRDGYGTRIRETVQGRCATLTTEVADRWQGPPSYHLMHFSKHRDGFWAMTEVGSLAAEEYRRYCFDIEGMLDFEPLDDRERAWIAQIVENLESILAEGKAFRPVERLADVYGDTLGYAREMHVRKALKELHKGGKIKDSCVGKKIPEFLVSPTR